MIGIELRGAYRSFHVPGAIRRKPALIDITLDVAAGETLVLRGDNGAGKSTLLRLIAGAHRPDRGTVRLLANGTPLDPSRIADPSLRAQIGYLGTESGLYSDLTIRENLELYHALYMRDRASAKAVRAESTGALLELLGLESHAETLLRGCSQGIARRAAIARTLISSPSLLLMDEPLAHLDSASQERFEALIAERERAGATIVVASHDRVGGRERRAKELWLAGGRLVAVAEMKDNVSPLPAEER